jgi:hypothetical protein
LSWCFLCVARISKEHVTDDQRSDGSVSEAQQQSAVLVDAFEHATDGLFQVERGSNRDAFAEPWALSEVRWPEWAQSRAGAKARAVDQGPRQIRV